MDTTKRYQRLAFSVRAQITRWVVENLDRGTLLRLARLNGVPLTWWKENDEDVARFLKPVLLVLTFLYFVRKYSHHAQDDVNVKEFFSYFAISYAYVGVGERLRALLKRPRREIITGYRLAHWCRRLAYWTKEEFQLAEVVRVVDRNLEIYRKEKQLFLQWINALQSA